MLKQPKVSACTSHRMLATCLLIYLIVLARNLSFLHIYNASIINDVNEQSSTKPFLAEQHRVPNSRAEHGRIISRYPPANRPTSPAIKVPEEFSKEESFGACLLLKDENHRLVEWIAYHYFALPLRTLIVAIDPDSKSSPTKILNRWRPVIDIYEWEDEEKYDPGWSKGFKILRESERWSSFNETHKAGFLVHRHLQRQRIFYHQCTQKLIEMNRTWSILHDVDEYVALDENLTSDRDKHKYGNILRLMKDLDANKSLYADLPKIDDREDRRERRRSQFNSSCTTLPRVRYSAIESSNAEINHGVPTSVVDPMQFNTLRFRFPEKEPQSNGKVILRLDDIPSEAMKQRTLRGLEIHDAFGSKYCNEFVQHTLLQINHYYGSWEAFSHRVDYRSGRDRATWEAQALKARNMTPTDHIRSWVQDFVDWQGEDSARYLLEGVGEFQ